MIKDQITFVMYDAGAFNGSAGSYAGQGICSICCDRPAAFRNKKRTCAYCTECKERIEAKAQQPQQASTPMRSKRKPHNHLGGYVCERKVQHKIGGHIVVFDREKGANDIDGDYRWIAMHLPSSIHLCLSSKAHAISVMKEGIHDPYDIFGHPESEHAEHGNPFLVDED